MQKSWDSPEDFYRDLERAAHSAAEKVSQNLDEVTRVGELKQELAHTYRQLEDVEEWALRYGQGWLNFWRWNGRKDNRAQRYLNNRLFSVIAEQLEMPNYDPEFRKDVF